MVPFREQLVPFFTGEPSFHSQEKQLTPLYIFTSISFELYLYSWIDGLDDDIQLRELFLLRVFLIIMLTQLELEK